MGSVRLAGSRIAHLLGVTVIGCNQELAVNGFHRFNDLRNTVIQGFYRFDGCIIDTGVANHVAVRVVTDDGVIFTAVDGCQQLFGQLGGAHLWL
ncbi:hypothetical protein D3C80_1739180 [compost metagenome]